MLGQGMGGVTDACQWNAAQLPKEEGGFLMILPDAEGGVELVIFHQAQEGGEGDLADVRPEKGKFLTQPLKDRREEPCLHAVVTPQLQGDEQVVMSQPLPCGQGGPEDELCVRDKEDALLRQGHTLAGADKELHSQLLLQSLYLMADRRLRDLQLPGRL